MQKKKKPSAFIRKILDILQRDDVADIIAWTQNGSGFMIHDLSLFECQILPQYFKHQKYSSFVRQLNMYGFHKQKHPTCDNYFQHQSYNRGDSVSQIKRKPQKKKRLSDQKISLSQGNLFHHNNLSDMSNIESQSSNQKINLGQYETKKNIKITGQKVQALQQTFHLQRNRQNIAQLCEQAIIQNQVLRKMDKILKQKSLELKMYRLAKLKKEADEDKYTNEDFEKENRHVDDQIAQKLKNIWEIIKGQTLKINMQLEMQEI